MKKNMGSVDRIIRFVVAAVIAVLIIIGQLKGTVAVVLGILAGIFVVTSVISFCPLYVPFKFSTRKK